MIQIVAEFLRWYPFHRGRLLLQGIDIIELLEELELDAALDVMRELVAQDILKNTETNEVLFKARAIVNGIIEDRPYDPETGEYRSSSNGPRKNDGLHENYIEPTEEGYLGLLPPLG